MASEGKHTAGPVKPPGYTIWHDDGGWRFTAPDGSYDSKALSTCAGAIAAAVRHAAIAKADGRS